MAIGAFNPGELYESARAAAHARLLAAGAVPPVRGAAPVPPTGPWGPWYGGASGAASAAPAAAVAPAAGAAAGAAPAATSAAAPSGAFARMATGVPTLARGAGALGRGAGMLGKLGARFLPGAGVAGAVLGEGLGVLNTSADPSTTKLDVATRGFEGVGRLGGAGAGAGLGALAGGPIGAVVGGTLGYFAPNAIYEARDWFQDRGRWAPSAPKLPAQVSVPQSPNYLQTAQRDVDTLNTTMAAVPPAPALVSAPSAAAPRAPFVDVTGTSVPLPGMGAIRNTRTGAVTSLDSGVPRTASGAAPLHPVASFFGAGMELRARANQQAAGERQAKVVADLLAKGPQAERDTAAAANERVRTAAAEAHLKANPGDFGGAAAIAAGRAVPTDRFTVPVTAMPDPKTGATPVLNTARGTMQMVTPTKGVFTKADLEANMKKLGNLPPEEARARVLRDARAAGYVPEAGL